MNSKEKDHFIAEQIMGWILIEEKEFARHVGNMKRWVNTNGNIQWFEDEYEPTEDIGQAIQAAEILRLSDVNNSYWKLSSPEPPKGKLDFQEKYFYACAKYKNSFCWIGGKNPAMTLCNAIIQIVQSMAD